MTPKYAIGTIFQTRGKSPRICTVTDILRTYNAQNDLVEIRYVAEHQFMGQTVVDRTVNETTIAMGLQTEAIRKATQNQKGE